MKPRAQNPKAKIRNSFPGSNPTPGQLVARANKWRDQYNPLRGLDVRRAIALCEDYNRGWMSDLQWTYFHIEQADPDLFTLCDRRISAILEMDWEISVVPETKRGSDFDEDLANEQVAALRCTYDRIDNLCEAIEHMVMASFRGFSLAEKWRGEDGSINHLEIADHWNLVRDGLRGPWKYNPDATRNTFESLPTENLLDLNDFVFREVKRHINHIALKKFVRTALGEKDWTAFLEIYGIPSGVVVLPEDVPADKQKEYETAAAQIAEGGNGALPHGSEYKPNDSPRGVDPFSGYLRYFTEKLIMAGTGGLLTVLTQSGSGTLAGSAHMEAFRSLGRGEARKINEVFQRDIDAEVLDRQFPEKPRLAYFELKPNQEKSVGEIADTAVKLSSAGFVVDPEELSEQTGYTLTLKAAAPQPVPPQRPDLPPEAPKEPEELDPENHSDPQGEPMIRNRRADNPSVAKLFATARMQLSTEEAKALKPVAKALEVVLASSDDNLQAALVKFQADLPNLLRTVNADSATAQIIEDTLRAAILDGFEEGKTR